MKNLKSLVVLVLACALAFVLAACGNSGSGSASASASNATASASSSAASTELVGKPWVTSVLQGNLPAEKPELKDDLYTSVDYDYLAEHQSEGGMLMRDRSVELQQMVTGVIKDSSKTNHDLEQLRIMYNQAADTEKLKEIGFSEVQPYLDRIDAVKSIDELNALLVADDFPFSPFISALVKTNDTRETNIVGVVPNFLLCNPFLSGGTYYKDTDDSIAQDAALTALSAAAMYTMADFISLGIDQNTAQSEAKQLIEFEKSHGKYLDSNGQYLKEDYGAAAEASRANVFAFDEMCALCPNFPLKETLAKMKKDGSEKYSVEKAWLEAFNGVWTADNLDSLKLMAKAKVLAETRPYRDQSAINDLLEQYGQPAPDADATAWAACNKTDTFGQVLAKTYVDDCLPANAQERLTGLTNQLVDGWKGLVDSTAWLGEDSKKNVVEKLDHITLNVLEPVCGYFDYSKLELVPTDQGGTLLKNYLTCKQYRYDREAELIGQPAVAASPWFGIEPTVMNAFYDSEGNSINIMPGYISSATYREDMTDEELLAAIGFTIGHEISHGFDYTGSQFDAYGQPNPVLAEADVDKFVTKITALARYYSTIEMTPDMNVDGQNVIAEAGADLAGMQVALEVASKSDNFDYGKFFNTFASLWAQVVPEAQFAVNALDTHPLDNLRVNVNSQMFDPIYDKLGVSEGDGMYLAPNERIVIWGPNA